MVLHFSGLVLTQREKETRDGLLLFAARYYYLSAESYYDIGQVYYILARGPFI